MQLSVYFTFVCLLAVSAHGFIKLPEQGEVPKAAGEFVEQKLKQAEILLKTIIDSKLEIAKEIRELLSPGINARLKMAKEIRELLSPGIRNLDFLNLMGEDEKPNDKPDNSNK